MKFLLSIVLIVVISCSQKIDNKGVDRFTGLWQTHTSESDMYEEWTKSTDGILHGKSYVMNDSDTLVYERIKLRKEGRDTFYIPIVKEQNNGEAVKFRLIASNDTVFIFENKQHDFPQRISYRFVGKDSMIARIEGLQNEEYRKEDFFFRRVK